MRFVVAPDSYKGSLSAAKVGEIMARAIRHELPEAVVRVVPMADGGEGTVEALVKARQGDWVPMEVAGPLGEPVDSVFGLIAEEGRSERTAVLEAAAVCGLPMVQAEQRNPLQTTSRGLGEAILRALDQGVRRLVIGLGGSATNDGGLGLLLALGARAADGQGVPIRDGFGRDVGRVATLELSGLDVRLRGCELIVASDVQNPLCGETGASHVYGPQKGATPRMVTELDEALARFADIVEAGLGLRGLRDQPGAGAAGGLGFALQALGATMRPGAELVAGMTGLQALIREADWVLTGEGRSDGQTLFGKLPARVADWAEEAGAKAVLISGSLGDDSEPLYERFAGCFAIVPGPATLDACLAGAEQNLYRCTRSVIRVIAAGQK